MSAEPARSNPFAVPLATVFVVLVQTCSRPSGVCFLMVTWCCLSPGWVSWPLCSRTFSRNLRCVTSEYPCCREREYRHFRAVTRKGNRKHKSTFLCKFRVCLQPVASLRHVVVTGVQIRRRFRRGSQPCKTGSLGTAPNDTNENAATAAERELKKRRGGHTGAESGERVHLSAGLWRRQQAHCKWVHAPAAAQ